MSAVGGLQKSIGSLEAPFWRPFLCSVEGWGAVQRFWKRFWFLAPLAQEVELPIDSAPLAVEEKALAGSMELLKGSLVQGPRWRNTKTPQIQNSLRIARLHGDTGGSWYSEAHQPHGSTLAGDGLENGCSSPGADTTWVTQLFAYEGRNQRRPRFLSTLVLRDGARTR